MFYLHFFALSKCHITLEPESFFQVFYLLSSSDVAYLDCVGFYKAFNFAASLKIEC